MKSLGGLWRAIGSTSPRNALPNVKCPASSPAVIRWKSSGLGYHRLQLAERAGSLPQEKGDREENALSNAIDEAPASEPTGSPAQTESAAGSSAYLLQPMRNIMRQLPHPVVVITTLDTPIIEDQEPTRPPVPRAMTVSSFTSLTIDPVPHVTFNVTLPSRTHRALEACGIFNVHILEGNHRGALVADRFTRGCKYPDEGLGILEGLGDLGVEVIGQSSWRAEWERAKWEWAQAGGASTGPDSRRRTPRTIPMLRGRGILHVLECRYAKLLAPLSFGADQHAIVVGEVLNVVLRDSSAEPSELSLAYADRGYRRLGDQLLKREPDQSSADRVTSSPDERSK